MSTIQEQLRKAVIVIPKTSLVLQEFLALLTGIKPVLLHEITPSDLELIKTNFPNLNIVCHDKVLWGRTMSIGAISKNQLLAERVTDLYHSGEGNDSDIKMIGKLLGYPQCCVNNYLSYMRQGFHHDFSLITHETYQSSKKFNFLVNNLLNFSTRVSNEGVGNFTQYYQLNKNSGISIPVHYFQFIFHIPCSYDCSESIQIGEQIRFLLKKYAPKIEEEVEHTLSKPILFFDLFELIIFDGYVENGILRYNKILPPLFSVNKGLLDNIKNGNRIIVSDQEIKVFKNDLCLFTYKKKNIRDGFIIDFSKSD